MLSTDDIANKSPDEIVSLVNRILQSKDNTIDNLNVRLQALLAHRFGSRSEKEAPNAQGCLFNEAKEPENLDEVTTVDNDITVASHQRKKSGRKPLPAELPRVQKVYDIADTDKHCACGCKLTCIGELKSEQLEFIPAQVRVIEHIRKKYACRSCEETILTAPGPKLPIPKSIASPGLLSHIITSKLVDHLPLYRQEAILQRAGIDIARNTLSHWFIKCGQLLKPLIKLMHQDILAYDIGYSDETVVQVLKEPGRPRTSKSYMWHFIGGPPDKRSHIYHYNPSRSHQVAKDFWQGFTGYLHSDGFSGYQVLFNISDIQGVHCWAHARRKFFEITRTTKRKGLAHQAMKQIQQLYRIESLAKEDKLTPEEAKRRRQTEAIQILNEFKAWLDTNIQRTPPKSPIGKAIAYCLKF